MPWLSNSLERLVEWSSKLQTQTLAAQQVEIWKFDALATKFKLHSKYSLALRFATNDEVLDVKLPHDVPPTPKSP